MKYLINNTDQFIEFGYGGIRYEFKPGVRQYLEDSIIAHYLRNVGGLLANGKTYRLDIEDPREPKPESPTLDSGSPTDLTKLSWNELQKMATDKGVKAFGRKRGEIEKELLASL